MRSASPPNRRAFLKQLGLLAGSAPFITSGLRAQNVEPRLRHAAIGVGGMGWSDLQSFASHPRLRLVALCDVDAKRSAEARKRFPDVPFYRDWRALLERHGAELDSVNVSTPDHMHAPIAHAALQLGKHVYGQKPLAHNLHETRQLTLFARRQKVVTQMGIQVHSSGHYQLGAKLIRDGVIGKIQEVHTWCAKSWGDAGTLPDRTDPVPEELDWNLWLGVAAGRPFIGDGYYHPNNWRKRLDFGTGTFGDMGCHIFDPVFLALGCLTPLTVRSTGPAPNATNWALDSRIHYTFAGNALTADKTLPMSWYDGAGARPRHLQEHIEGDDLPGAGALFIGTEGVMLLPHVARPQLYPDAKFAGFEFPNVRGADHYHQFVDACLGRGQTTAHFDYAGPLTEAVLLGGVASRFPQTTLRWNARRLRFEERAANAFLRREYREGWRVRGLG